MRSFSLIPPRRRSIASLARRQFGTTKRSGPAEITFNNLAIGSQTLRFPLHHNPSSFHHVTVVRDLERSASNLLEQEKPNSRRAHILDDHKDIAHDNRRKAEAGLIQHQ